MKNFLVNEFLEERKPSGKTYEFDNFSKVQDFMNTFQNNAYSKCYRNEPPYPYVWVRVEEITENGQDLPISYCYFAT